MSKQIRMAASHVEGDTWLFGAVSDATAVS